MVAARAVTIADPPPSDDRLWLAMTGDGWAEPVINNRYIGRLRKLGDLPLAKSVKSYLAETPPAVVGVKQTEPPACGNHGTAIEFVGSPKEAARQAKKEEKLVFVLHVSGHFEDPRFT